MSTDVDAPLLTAEEVGRLLRLKPASVYEAASDGRIPCVKLWQGRRKSLVRFRRDDIAAFIESKRTPVHASSRRE